MTAPTCATCRWYVRGHYSLFNHSEGWQPGSCRKSAPSERGFPPVKSTDWCGERAPKEQA